MGEKRKSTRRQFLAGRSAADALADAAAGVAANTPDPEAWRDPVAQPYLVRVGRRAMACEFELFLNAGQYAHGSHEALAALDLVDALEAQLTVHRDDSELSDVNRRAADEDVAVAPGLFALLQQCGQLHEETGGAFDVTSGPLSRLWGFHRRQGALPEQQAIEETLQRVGSDKLRLDDSNRSVRFAVAGMELNLGSIGKGYALDRAAEQLEDAGIADFLWHGGQSSILARGSRAVAAGAPDGWHVCVMDPLRPGKQLATIQLRDRALGTSGAATQFFRHAGRRYGHILDPRTGWPAEGVYSATALAPTAAEADALGTAFYIMGLERAADYCDAHPEVGMLMVCLPAGGGPAQVQTAGLAENEWRLAGGPAHEQGRGDGDAGR